MTYQGSKAKITKFIAPIIHAELKKLTELTKHVVSYVEPFAGGGNMLSAINWSKRYGNEINQYQHALLVQIAEQKFTSIDNVDRALYYDVKQNPSMYDPALVGFVRVVCSFGSKPWGGYAKNAKGRNYAAAGSRNILKQQSTLKNVLFSNVSYEDMHITSPSVIYCDAPYRNTEGYNVKFNNDVFEEWCIDMSINGHTVLVSERNITNDKFTIVWEAKHISTMNLNATKYSMERLYIVH